MTRQDSVIFKVGRENEIEGPGSLPGEPEPLEWRHSHWIFPLVAHMGRCPDLHIKNSEEEEEGQCKA